MKWKNKSRPVIVGIFLCLLLPIPPAWSAVEPARPQFENDLFRLRLIPRTPNQIAAFYEARGFPDDAVNTLKQLCFITVGFRNKSDRIIWHDLRKWEIRNAQGPITRYAREYWPGYWRQNNLAQRFQSTFRWTLMPEQLDFRPAEAEGGNIILPRIDGSFEVQAQFTIGERDAKKVVEVTIDKLYCAEDAQ